MPDIKRNLLSIAPIIDRDLKDHFNNNGLEIVDLQGKVVSKKEKEQEEKSQGSQGD